MRAGGPTGCGTPSRSSCRRAWSSSRRTGASASRCPSRTDSHHTSATKLPMPSSGSIARFARFTVSFRGAGGCSSTNFWTRWSSRYVGMPRAARAPDDPLRRSRLHTPPCVSAAAGRPPWSRGAAAHDPRHRLQPRLPAERQGEGGLSTRADAARSGPRAVARRARCDVATVVGCERDARAL